MTVLRRILTVSSLTLAIAIGAVSPSFAADTVVQTVTAGGRTASIAALIFSSVAYSHSAQTQTGSMSLTADDSSGSGAGWNVTILSSAFVYSGANGGTDIAAANLSLSSAAAPVMTAGQAVDATNGPKIPSVSRSARWTPPARPSRPRSPTARARTPRPSASRSPSLRRAAPARTPAR